ncbi:Sodium/calcium exchanger protein-domain-containing protein [Leptodontidium sp. 2 PMI_412]|nr:Sodium/calcium exchanger protein-domain-containing protein [Leptodontidium sp. 2 PMI_412]
MSNYENSPLLGAAEARKPLWKDNRLYVRWPANICRLTWLFAASSNINALLVFVPVGSVAGARSWNPTAVFTLNFLAIIPLSVLLTFVINELSARLDQPWKELFSVMLTNSVKIIINVTAVQYNEIRVAQSCMLGTILSNILLILGCCFLVGGIRSQESNFNVAAASTMSSLMVIASVSLIIPATLDTALHNSKSGSRDEIVMFSRGTAVILLLIYILYLYFRLISHASLFNEEQAENGEEARQSHQAISPIASIIALVIVLVAIAISAHFLIGSINPLFKTTHIGKTFIGLILLPILGNGKERITAISVAYKGQMNLGIDVAIGSSIQIALFVTPSLVILSWIMHTADPMTLHFQSFETIIFVVSVLVVNSLIQDGKSNYLEGAMCLGTYIIIALAFRLYPDDTGDVGTIVGVLGGRE